MCGSLIRPAAPGPAPAPAPRPHPSQVKVYKDHPEGVVSIKYKTLEGSEACREKMNGRCGGARACVRPCPLPVWVAAEEIAPWCVAGCNIAGPIRRRASEGWRLIAVVLHHVRKWQLPAVCSTLKPRREEAALDQGKGGTRKGGKRKRDRGLIIIPNTPVPKQPEADAWPLGPPAQVLWGAAAQDLPLGWDHELRPGQGAGCAGGIRWGAGPTVLL